jgi:hypothetical protein
MGTVRAAGGGMGGTVGMGTVGTAIRVSFT